MFSKSERALETIKELQNKISLLETEYNNFKKQQKLKIADNDKITKPKFNLNLNNINNINSNDKSDNDKDKKSETNDYKKSFLNSTEENKKLRQLLE